MTLTFRENMKTDTLKKVANPTIDGRTWTFQPDHVVREAIRLQYPDLGEPGCPVTKTDLCNDALRAYLPEAVRTVLDAEHAESLANLRVRPTLRANLASARPASGEGLAGAVTKAALKGSAPKPGAAAPSGKASAPERAARKRLARQR